MGKIDIIIIILYFLIVISTGFYLKKRASKNIEAYFTEEIDKKIIEDYNNTKNDITKIAKNNTVEIYQVVSLLVKYKIISKRNEARGYDKYKETEEYKQKLEKK